MPTISREFAVSAPPETVWSRISDTGAVNELIDFIGEVTVDGDYRSCALGDQGVLRELIVSVDPAARRIVYSVQESPFGFEHHNAAWQVLPDGNGGTRFAWITDFTPESVGPPLEGAIDRAVESLKRTLV